MKPFLRFVGTTLRNQIAEIPGQPRFCVKRVLFFLFSLIFMQKRGKDVARREG